MLGLAKRLRAKILQASTSEVYGDPNVHPQPEEYWGHVNSIGTRSCYDEGKRCAETLFFDYWRQHQLRIKVARIFNTYGPRMHPNDGRVVSNFIIQALLEATTYCPPTPDRGADLLSVPSAVRRDGAYHQAIRLPWHQSGYHSATRRIGRLHPCMDDARIGCAA
jgi:nucleoside-diphosphate-sugar epimerase